VTTTKIDIPPPDKKDLEREKIAENIKKYLAIVFDEFRDALEEAEFCARDEKLTYGIRLEGNQFEVYQIERRGPHNMLDVSGRRSGRK